MILYGLPSSPIHLPQGDSYYPGSGNHSYNSVLVKRVTTPWDENSVTWNTQPNTTVINESLIPPSTSQWNYNASVDVTNIVETMVKNSSNNGFLLKLTSEEVYRSMGFCSSEYSDASKHPKLIVVYK